ncbi:hypothetical protein H072_681 [Dactylellina haptotyla CBS 200.50]|uniref:GH16 domain-containing protein n=1 Tax=Dactylellina haptotyla (strain CBS 200.50) TaxID=1284197 RepID=S8AWK2_DACHA|nr:hypothetical protein H072_681 [Dactylellina haptotyla CBS 200.50]
MDGNAAAPSGHGADTQVNPSPSLDDNGSSTIEHEPTVGSLPASQENSEQPETILAAAAVAVPTITVPAPVRPAPAPVQPPQVPQQSVWARKAVLLKKRASSYRSEPVMPRPPSPPKLARQAYTPVVPSPLNPTTSTSELELDIGRSSQSSSQEYRDAVVSVSNSASSESHQNQKSAKLLSPEPIMLQASLLDLGREYDRYPARTPRSSFMASQKTASNTPSQRASNPSLDVTASEKREPEGEKDLEKRFEFDPYCESITKPTLIDAEFPLYIDEKEADDYMHNPGEGDNRRSNHTLRDIGWRGFLSFCSFWIFVAGLVCLFIVLPVLTFTGYVDTPMNSGGTGESSYHPPVIQPWEYVETNYTFPILSGIRTSMVDPDTPEYAKTRKSVDGKTLKLVFSDEFNQDGRAFYEGDDQFWTSPDLHYAATTDLEWYDPDAVTTKAGTLRLTLDAWQNHDLNYRSGMLQSWNKLCFKGGVLEVSASLAGPGGKMGLWPGIWTLGNLARPGYLATSDGTWPYAYDDCDVGITPNQSSPDGISFLPGQRLNSCTCKGEDHPNAGVGRGAPEIDALEGSTAGGINLGVASQSSQIAPFDIYYIPDYDFLEIHNHSVTEMNTWAGGPFQQAISGITALNNDWYDGKVFQKYAFEYEPGKGTGKITWFIGDEPSFAMRGESTGPNGNIGTRHISQEPMSVVLNLGLSHSWAYIDFPAINEALPTTMYIDYVRIYQPEGEEMITCDPPGYPTTDYIQKHLNAYTNPNLTSWKSAGYEFPQNTLMNGCKQ